MTLDVSLEAIEADLAIADRGGQVATIAMARAQVRATLLAAQPVDHQGRHEAPPQYGREGVVPDIVVAEGLDSDVFTVPKSATWEDRVTAAAMLLGIDEASLRFGLSPVGRLKEQASTEPEDDDDDDEEDGLEVDPGHDDTFAPLSEPDDTEDVFAEARKARSKK